MLKKYYKLYPAMRSCIVNTFGFGYSLNSELLQQVATEGQGSYGFIPDVGFVGTAFIHAISNTLAVCNKNLEVELIPAAGVTIGAGAVVGGHPIESSGMVTTIKLGAVSLGQTKDVLVRIPKSATTSGHGFVGVTARYVDACTGEPRDCDLIEVASVLPTPDSPAETLYNFYRLKMAGAIRDASMQFGGLSTNQLEQLTMVRRRLHRWTPIHSPPSHPRDCVTLCDRGLFLSWTSSSSFFLRLLPSPSGACAVM